MRFASVCSGIEAASVAFGPLGFEAAWFAEIEPFPCALLAHRFPDVPNHGDMTTLPDRIRSGEVESPETLVGGTPCQAFSVAGLRASLDDARGNLTLTFCEIADAMDSARAIRGERPVVVMWENVPGVLRTPDNAFGCFLGALSGEDCPLVAPGGKWPHAGYVDGPKRAVAWRVLDAQYFGLAQRRKRVFVVASARDGFDPAAVLFEFDGVRRDSPPSREKRETAPTIPSRSTAGGGLGTDFDCDGGLIEQPYSVANCLTQRMHKGINSTVDEGQDGSLSFVNRGVDTSGSTLIHPTVPTVPTVDASYGRLHGASCQDANHGHSHLMAFTQNQRDEVRTVEVAGALSAEPGMKQQTYLAIHPIPFDTYAIQAGALRVNPASRPDGVGVQSDHAYTLEARSEVQAVAFQSRGMQVRRLTPVECEKLQGFPPGWTQIPWRKKPAEDCPDGPRYKAIGNSWAVPVVRWIGRRILTECKRLDKLESTRNQ